MMNEATEGGDYTDAGTIKDLTPEQAIKLRDILLGMYPLQEVSRPETVYGGDVRHSVPHPTREGWRITCGGPIEETTGGGTE